MSSYTIDGYVAALKLREKRTVLVEGSDDKKFIARIAFEFAELGRAQKLPFVVDTAELVRAEGPAIGNRTLVEAIHVKAGPEGCLLVCIVDREFREFSIGDSVQDVCTQHVVSGETLFWTRGHSVENYYFESRLFVAFLKRQFAEQIDLAALRSCEREFVGLVLWAAAVSLGVREMELIERSSGAMRVGHWDADGAGRVRLNIDAYSASLLSRGVESERVSELAERIAYYYEVVSKSDPSVVTRAAHGHLSWEILWSGMGAMLQALGAQKAAVEGVAYGYEDAKRRSCNDVLAHRVTSNSGDVLPGVWAVLFQEGESDGDVGHFPP
jgi:hypothetical protein